MSRHPAVWPDVRSHLKTVHPDRPVLYFDPAALQATLERFRAGFPGLVTFAVKANDSDAVIENLVQAGIGGFDVASPEEMEKVRRVSPSAVMHYNNPVRSKAEIRTALEHGIMSYSVDDIGELTKFAGIVPAEGVEVSVRLKLPVEGGYYDFGSKFGAEPGTMRRTPEAGGGAWVHALDDLSPRDTVREARGLDGLCRRVRPCCGARGGPAASAECGRRVSVAPGVRGPGS